MKRLVIATSVCMALFGTSSTATANEYGTDTAGQLYISPRGGVAIGNNDSFPTSGQAGLAVGYNFTRVFALEAAGNGWVTGASARADTIWNIPLNAKLMPYFAAGFGYLYQDGSSLAYDVGGGFKYNVNDHFNFNLNYRYIQGMRAGMPRTNLLDIGFSIGFGGVDSQEDQSQSQREISMHKKYVLPKDVMECQEETAETMRESVGCYTLDGDVVTMHLDSKFGFDQTELTESSKTAINNLIKFMKQYPKTNVVLKGHASHEGTKAYNIKLSERRAKVVADYLQDNGIAKDRITTVGLGEANPIASNNTAYGREVNRRVETAIDVPATEDVEKDNK